MVETKKLKEVAACLNKESDNLNITIQKIQDKINGYNIGLEVWGDILISQDVKMPEDINGNFISPFHGATSKANEVILGYANTQEGWGLAIQRREIYYRPDLDDGDMEYAGSYNLGKPQSLLKASREIRIKALKYLQDLVDIIQGKAEESLDSIEEAKKLADEL